MSELPICALPYPEQSADWFAKLRSMPYALIFDSASWSGARGRFDIMCADPDVLVTHKAGLTWTDRRGEVEPSPLPPLELLRELLATYPRPASQLDQGWPFSGGLAGFFGYDFGRQLEQLPRHSAAEYAMPEIAVGLYPWAIVVDHASQRAALVCARELESDYRQNILALLDGGPGKNDPGFELLTPFVSNLNRQAYGRAFRQVAEYIRAGDCYQVNLAQRFSSRFRGDPWQAFRRLTGSLSPPYSAYFEAPSWSILSLSPETFLRVDGRRVETSPIKGTRPRGATALEDESLRHELGNSAKDRAENLMIVDLLRNDLGKTCVPGSVRVEKLWDLETFANVHHLVSTISAELAEGRDALDLFGSSFPGGSITGAPKHRAMQIIDELEPHRRSVYCGSLAYLGSDGTMASNIAIRTVVCESDRIHCWAGGGLVADSDEEAEYQECLTKVGRILETLQAMSITNAPDV